MPRLLGILRDYHITADFFVLGEIAERYPDCLREIMRHGHEIGSHSDNHEHLCEHSHAAQLRRVRNSISSLHQVTRREIRMFRAPNFSANGDSIRVLEQTGISLDSSVLPGRHARRRRLLLAYDHRGAPRTPYHPSTEDVDSPGESHVLEVPVTENPLQPGTPIGLGFLNRESVQQTLQAMQRSTGDYVAFLIHPWEGTELPVKEKRLPRWLATSCRSDTRPLEGLLAAISGLGGFVTIDELASRGGA